LFVQIYYNIDKRDYLLINIMIKVNYLILVAASLSLINISCNQKRNMQNKEVKVVISTSLGTIKLKLYDETPLHRDNFVKLINSDFYKERIFHRVIRTFMIQGGDCNLPESNPDKGQDGKYNYTVPAEINPLLIHKKGALAAARQGDAINPKKASSSTQFYIVQGQPLTEIQLLQQNAKVNYTEDQLKTYATIGGTPSLDGNYTVFGEVTEGLEVIDKIAAVQTQRGDRPVNDIIFNIKITK
jgi:cyclophilin family peptidyl-prolyl cis-trans isomerase